jgi:hypothetical protein
MTVMNWEGHDSKCAPFQVTVDEPASVVVCGRDTRSRTVEENKDCVRTGC